MAYYTPVDAISAEKNQINARMMEVWESELGVLHLLLGLSEGRA